MTTRALTQKSEALFERAKKVIPGGINSPVRAFLAIGGKPFFTERAQGANLYTTDGQTLIDFVGTWGPAIHGHNHPAIRSAINHALNKGTSFGTLIPIEVIMAEKIVSAVKSINKVRMVNSGTEATMAAIRLARGYTNRDKIIKFSGCYHGHVDSLLIKAGSGALTFGNPDSAGIPKSFIQETILLAYNNLELVKNAFEKYPNEIAGIILEPYTGNCGVIIPDADYLKGLRKICTQYGALLIFDEVMTGFRIGIGGVQEKYSIEPDLTCLGKIIGGGLPVGAFGGREEIMNHLSPEGPVYQAGTFSGNPLAMAAGLASIELLEQTLPYDTLNKMGQFIKDSILVTAKEKGIPIQVPQTGSMFSIFFSEKPVSNFEEVLITQTNPFKKVFRYALNHGVFLPPSPYEACFISTAHKGKPIEMAAEIICSAIKAL